MIIPGAPAPPLLPPFLSSSLYLLPQQWVSVVAVPVVAGVEAVVVLPRP